MPHSASATEPAICWARRAYMMWSWAAPLGGIDSKSRPYSIYSPSQRRLGEKGELRGAAGNPSPALVSAALAGAAQLLGEALEVHQVQDALVDGAPEVLPQEGAVDALLVELDDGIGWERLVGV